MRRVAFPLLVAVILVVGGAASAQGAARVVDPPRGDLRVAVFGDFNGPYGSTSYPAPVARVVRALVEVWRPDLLLSPGDVVAGQSRELSDETRARMWAAFDREVAEPLRRAGIPYAVAMGNHDASGLRDGSNGFLYERDRRAAEAYWGADMYRGNHDYLDRQGYPFDYAFRSGGAFVAVIDASSAIVTERQREWLRGVLGRPEAREARVRWVVGHLPLAAVGRGRDRAGEVIAEADALQAVLEEGRVDLYVSGHHAAYYPGRLEGLELLFAGGVGARALLAGDAPPRSTITLVDVLYEPLEIRYTTFDVVTMERVPPDALPAEIVSGGRVVRRSERAGPHDAPAPTPRAEPERSP